MDPIQSGELPHPAQTNFLVAQSRLLKAGLRLRESYDGRSGSVQQATAADGSASGQNLYITTSQMIQLFQRFRIRELTFQQLLDLPLSRLSPVEKQFVQFLRRNENIFQQIAALDHHPESLSAKDLKLAAQLAGDSLLLSDADLKYLKTVTAPVAAPDPAPFAASRQSRSTPASQANATSSAQINQLLERLSPNQPLSLEQLRAMHPDRAEPPLNSEERETLRLLQSRPVQKILTSLTQPTDGVLTPEIIRILTSLIWNPAIYSAVPIVLMKEPSAHDEEVEEAEKVDGVEAIEPVELIDAIDIDEHSSYLQRYSRLHVELHADTIRDICHRINPRDGHVTLDQLRQYQPRNLEETKVINTLKKAKIFKVLADMDHHPDSISEKDIKIALSAGAIMVYDPYIMLLILP